MRSKFTNIIISLCFLASLAHTQHIQTFAQWKSQHSKNYNDETEEIYRTYIFNQNLRQINLHNSDPLKTHTEAVNQFSDLTLQQFSNLYLRAMPPNNYPVVGQQKDENDEQPPKDKIIPSDHSVLYPNASPVRNQGPCGSCYAFSVTSQANYEYFRTNNKEVTFSPQELVDCSQ